MWHGNDAKTLTDKIAVALLYYGLLRSKEVLILKYKDVKLNIMDDVEVDFPYRTKRTAKVFSFKVPKFLKPTFSNYMTQFKQDENTLEQRFLKNWSGCKDGFRRTQNYGANKVALLAKKVAEFLGKTGPYTSHSFRRSTATILAEAGISVVRLVHPGRWKSVVTA